MAVCYKKLWKLLIDKDMTKAGLRMASGVSSSTLAKMTRSDDTRESVLVRLCIQILPGPEREITDCKQKSCVSKPGKKQNATRRTAATRTTHRNVRSAIA